MNYYMGIDGGGSKLRIVIKSPGNKPIVDQTSKGINVRSTNQAQASLDLQNSIRAALNKTTIRVKAVGIGIAGAALLKDWVHETIANIIHDVPIVITSDLEIALIGVHGKRQGLLILAGTGSAAYGITTNGHTHQTGGWGYLLGDEGSGYWIGLQMLKAYINRLDGYDTLNSILCTQIEQTLQINTKAAILDFMYTPSDPPVTAIASLAPLVLASDDPIASQIIEQAAQALYRLAAGVTDQLGHLPIRFAGGILSSENRLSRRLCELLDLSEFPHALYEPVIGATLLAQEQG